MTLALAIDTTSDYLSLALAREGQVVGSHYAPCGTLMARTVLQQVDRLLAGQGRTPQDLDVLVANRGPGSFTGTRIGLALALTFAEVLRKPLIGVDSLDVLAAQVEQPRGATAAAHFHVVLNCARDEVYHASYRWREGQVEPLAPIRLSAWAELLPQVAAEPVLIRRFEPVHPGWEQALAALHPVRLAHAQPDGGRLLAVGLPRYLERPQGPFAPVQAVYLKSEAFRTWKPHAAARTGV